MFKKSKKANLLDWFYIIPFLVLLGIIIFACMIVVVKTEESGIFDDDAEAQAHLQSSKTSLLGFDSLFLFIIVGLSLFVIISSAVVYNHPAFFIIGFFLLCIAVVFAGTMSNAFYDFANADQIVASSLLYPKITFLMNNLPLYIAFLSMASLISGYIGYTKV